MDHLTDLWTEHHEAATLKQEEEEMKEGSVALPVWKDPKLAPVLDEMVGVGDPALLSHVTVNIGKTMMLAWLPFAVSPLILYYNFVFPIG